MHHHIRDVFMQDYGRIRSREIAELEKNCFHRCRRKGVTLFLIAVSALGVIYMFPPTSLTIVDNCRFNYRLPTRLHTDRFRRRNLFTLVRRAIRMQLEISLHRLVDTNCTGVSVFLFVFLRYPSLFFSFVTPTSQ